MVQIYGTGFLNDLSFGIELRSAVHFCPDTLIEAAKLSVLFEFLITNHSLDTVVAANIHIQRMKERYNFSLGEAILLMATDNLKKTDTLVPLLKSFTDNEIGGKGHRNKSAILGAGQSFMIFIFLHSSLSKKKKICSW